MEHLPLEEERGCVFIGETEWEQKRDRSEKWSSAEAIGRFGVVLRQTNFNWETREIEVVIGSVVDRLLGGIWCVVTRL